MLEKVTPDNVYLTLSSCIGQSGDYLSKGEKKGMCFVGGGHFPAIHTLEIITQKLYLLN